MILFVKRPPGRSVSKKKCNEVLLEQLEGRDDLQSITGQVSYIEELPLPQTVKDKLMENNNTEIYKRLAVESFADYLGKYLSYGIINAICFLISFAIATILMYMILYAVDILTALPVIGTLNRIGGICIGCIQGLIWIWVIFLIITIICDTPAGIYLQGQIRSDPILTWIYDNNMLMKIVLQIFGSKAVSAYADTDFYPFYKHQEAVRNVMINTNK